MREGPGSGEGRQVGYSGAGGSGDSVERGAERGRWLVLLGALASLLATTGTLAAMGQGGWAIWGVPVYLGVGVAVLWWPAALSLLVPAGVLLAGATVVGPGSGSVLLLGPVVVGIVLSAELLLMAQRRSTRLLQVEPPDWVGAAGAAVLAGGVFGVVVLVGGATEGPGILGGVMLPGPWDVLMAGVAVALVGTWLARAAR